MASIETREKRRANRMRKNQKALQVAELDEKELGLEVDEPEAEEIPEFEIVGKHYDEPMPGPTSYVELDAAKEAREQAYKVREETYTVQELVSNIAYSGMTPDQKSKAIVSVGEGFGSRLKSIVKDKVEKEFIDMDLLQLKAILARDSRHTSVIEKASDFIARTFTRIDPQSKTFLRMVLKETIDHLESGDTEENTGASGHLSRENIPALIQKAKEAGVGNSPNSIIIEKDASGSWRAVMWPSNNFKDLDEEILSEVAHKEYVEWVNENMDCAPVFVIGHTPGTAREAPVDFVGYENGFLLMSAPLTEKEAADLLRMQIKTDIGMSHGTLVLGRDPENPLVITKYRMVEVSDLPLERAANPFTDFDLLSKEADMDVKQYLVEMLGEERANNYLAKTALKQENLRKAGVEEKETKETPAPAPTTIVNNNAPSVDLKELVEKMSTELGMKELSDTIAGLIEKSEKVDVLEGLVKELAASKEDALAEMINPPASKSLVWLKSRPTQDAKNVLNEDKEEDKKLKKSQPELGWLSEATGTQPVQV